MKNCKDEQTKKKCTGCQKEYPATSEYFYLKTHHKRKTSFLESKCKDCSNKYSREYRRKHREKYLNTARAYRESLRGRFTKLGKYHHGHKVTITWGEFQEWYKLQPKRCCFCGIMEEDLTKVDDKINNKSKYLTIDRKDSNKPYEKGNLCLACYRCNLIKSDFFTPSEMEQIGTLFIKPKWRNGKH